MKFEFVKQDGSILDFSTRYIETQKQITVNVKVPLWETAGVHIDFEKLAELGLSVKYTPDKSQARIQYQKITFMYNNIPEFATRVQQLKAKYDELQVAYNCTTDDIATAIKTKFADSTQQATFLAEFNALLDKGVKLNYQAGMRLYYEYFTGQQVEYVDDFVMWTDFPVLIQWLPGTYQQKDIPANPQPEIVTTFERQHQLIGD